MLEEVRDAGYSGPLVPGSRGEVNLVGYDGMRRILEGQDLQAVRKLIPLKRQGNLLHTDYNDIIITVQSQRMENHRSLMG
jgi:hypothetical protein